MVYDGIQKEAIRLIRICFGIGLKHITPAYTCTTNFSTVSNQSVCILKFILTTKVGDRPIWRIKSHVLLEMYVMYESFVVGCCLLCAVVPSLLTYVMTLFVD